MFYGAMFASTLPSVTVHGSWSDGSVTYDIGILVDMFSFYHAPSI